VYPNENLPLALHYSDFGAWFAYSIRGHESAADRGASSTSGNHYHVTSGGVMSSAAANAANSHNNMQPYLVQRWIVKV
jgi:microcystin-dependent protein